MALSLRKRYLSSDVNRLVVTIHGYGSNMDDLHSFSDELKQFGHVVSFNAPHNTPWGGYAWFDLNFKPNGQVQLVDINQVESSIVLLKQEISKTLEDLTIKPEELILFGFSQGAMMAIEYAMRSKTGIKAACILSGRQALSEKSMNNQTPVIQTHGTLDEVIPVTDARLLNKVIEQNFEQSVYLEYPEMAHGISPKCWSDVKNELIRLTL